MSNAPKTISLSESQIGSFLAFLSQEQADLSKHIADLQERYNANQQTIEDLKNDGKSNLKQTSFSMDENAKNLPAGYIPGKSYWYKCEYVLTESGKFMTGKDVLNRVIELEPKLADEGTKVSVNVYTTLASKAKDGKLIRKESGQDGFLYAIPKK